MSNIILAENLVLGFWKPVLNLGATLHIWFGSQFFTKIETNFTNIKNNCTKIESNCTKIKTNCAKIVTNCTKIETNCTKIVLKLKTSFLKV